jgi:hypothetical protein
MDENRHVQFPKWALPSGKEVSYRYSNTGLYEIYFTSGGELPDKLRGKFTDPAIAEKFIQEYVDSRELKEAKAPTNKTK